MLAADGYTLSLYAQSPDSLLAEIRAHPSACATCLVSKEMMRSYFEEALKASLPTEPPGVILKYPSDA